MRLSARTIVLLAFACFVGLVILQVLWMRSAYEGEMALYAKEKKYFETALQLELKQDEVFQRETKSILDHNNYKGTITVDRQAWLNSYLNTTISRILKDREGQIEVSHFDILQHAHGQKPNGGGPVALIGQRRIPTDSFRHAGKLCLHCILGLPETNHDQYNYELAVFYDRDASAVDRKMGLLIAFSFLLVLSLLLLFLHILRKYRQERRLSDSKNDFINNLSHEIQTPVFAIQMANRLICERTADTNEVAPLVAIIDKETQQLKQHAAKILELASLENEQVQLNRKKVDLKDFIEAKRDTIEMMLRGKHGKLEIEHHPAPLLINIDPVHFNNVLLSLVENAMKYTEKQPRISIVVGEEGNSIFLRITDNGIGIAPLHLPHVFDKFYRVPQANNGVTGFGLGLSYAKHIVDLHGGDITISSVIAEGTVITIRLPKEISNV